MIRKTKNQFIIRGLTAVLLVVGLGSSHCLTPPKKQTSGHDFVSASRQEGPLTDLHAGQGRIEPAVPGFVGAVGGAMPAVVHIAAKRSPKVIERYESTSPLAEFFRKFEGMAESGHKKKADSSFKDTEVEVECSFVHKGLKGATRRLSRGIS